MATHWEAPIQYINLGRVAGHADVHGYMHGLASAAPGPEAELDALRGVYACKPTSELLGIYEQQQEVLLRLAGELQESTKRNIELSTSNLQQLQKLQSSSSPVVANIVMQPQRLSQLSNQVRQRFRYSSVPGLGMSGLPTMEAAPDMVAGGSTQSRSGGPSADGHLPLVHRDAGNESARQGICTQEDAAAILLQMSRRMADEPW